MRRLGVSVLLLVPFMLQCGCSKQPVQGRLKRVKDEVGNAVDVRVTTALPVAAPVESQPESNQELPATSIAPEPTRSSPTVAAPAERPELLPASAIHIQPIDPDMNADQRLEQTVLRMRKIVLACAQYALKEGKFPGNRGKLSWRVHILPYLGNADLHARFKLDEPWDSATNLVAASAVPAVYQAPFGAPSGTVFLAPRFPQSLLSDGTGMSAAEFTDAWSQTISLVMAAPEQAVSWTEPMDLEIAPDDSVASLAGAEGCLVALADGDVRWLDPQTDPRHVRALLTASGGETIDVQKVTRSSSAALGTLSRQLVSAEPEPTEVETPATSAATSIDNAQQPEMADIPDARLAVPDETTAAKAKAQLRASFKREIEQLKQGKRSKQEFAEELMQDLGSLDGDAAAAYVLLQTARDHAAEAGDFRLAQQATSELIARFRVNELELQRQTVLEAAESLLPHHADQNADLCKQAATVLKLAIAQDDFASAGDLLKVFVASARREAKPDRSGASARTVDQESRVQLQRLQTAEKELSELKKAYDNVPSAMQTLELSPDDAEANYLVGHYRCCLKLQWKTGLPHLAKGSDLRLKILAAEDLAASQTIGNAVNLANEYWTLAEQETGLTQRGLKLRAVHWYTQSLPKLPNGLNKVNAQRRIEEAKREYGDSLVEEALAMMSPQAATTTR